MPLANQWCAGRAMRRPGVVRLGVMERCVDEFDSGEWCSPDCRYVGQRAVEPVLPGGDSAVRSKSLSENSEWCCFRGRGRMARRDEGEFPSWVFDREQRSQTASASKTLRAAGLLAGACVGSPVAARCGDAPASPPWPHPKSLTAAPLAIFRQALWVATLFLRLYHSRTNSISHR